MANQTGVWGIDLGQCALKALRLEDIEGTITATAFDYIEHPKILSQPDADPDQLTREALEKFLSRNNIRGDQIAISVPGQSGLARFVKLPPVEEKKITDIVRFEAKQQIPFNLEEVVWDYQKITSGAITDGYAMETEIGLFAMKRDMVNRSLQQFQEAGIEVHLVQMAPLALCNFLAYDLLGKGPEDQPAAGPGKKSCVVGLDIGADSSSLVVTDGGKIIWQRPIPLGGNHFTRALTKDLKLTFAKAEHLKRNATKASPADLKKILIAIRPILNDFSGEVQRSLGYFSNTHRDAQIEYMIGLGNAFRLPGMQRFLGEKLQLDVRRLQKMEKLIGDAVVNEAVYTENILTFGVAYGLALQGVGQARLTTNLLPQELRVERMIRAKKPWAAVAAAALLLGTGALAVKYAVQARTYGDAKVITAMKASDDTAGRAAAAETEFQNAKKAAEEEEKAVKALVAGFPERTNWLKLFEFIGECVPRADGSNLPPDDKTQRAYNTKAAEAAMKSFEARRGALGGGGADEGDPLGSKIDDLIQVNIEAVTCRYCEDLGAYWRTATVGREPGDVRPTDQFSKPPEGKGWVVELRGYTFHKGEGRFVLDTLGENIVRLGMTKPQPSAKPAVGNPVPGMPPTGTGPTGTGPMGQPATGTPPTGMPPGGTPPAGAQPPGGQPMGAQPAAPSGTSGTAGSGTEKADGEEATKFPVRGRISHVLLYGAKPKQTDNTTSFDFIATSHIGALVGGRSGAGGTGEGEGGSPYGGMVGSTPGGMGTSMGSSPGGAGGAAPAQGATRAGWVPLSAESLGGGSTSGLNGGFPGGTGPGSPAPPMIPGAGSSAGGAPPMGMPGGPPFPGGSGTGTPAPRPGEPQAKHRRTEFVILFVWKEPTPSDELRGHEEITAPAAGGAAGGGFSPMPGGMAGM